MTIKAVKILMAIPKAVVLIPARYRKAKINKYEDKDKSKNWC